MCIIGAHEMDTRYSEVAVNTSLLVSTLASMGLALLGKEYSFLPTY